MKTRFFIIPFILAAVYANAQDKALVNTSGSPYAKLKSVDLDDVTWTGGFWKEQFEVEKNNTLPFMWKLYHDAKTTHAYRNFEIAAGLMKGKHDGPSFHDGDFYKLFEAMAAMYAATGDKKLDEEMDKAISLIAKAQRKDGYLHTPVLIEERWGTLGEEELQKQLGFEKYNMGHLMTAACVHYRATGKDSFLKVAEGVADYLYDFYKKASPELARNAICPSHYMGVVEMYRTTGNDRYLELAQNLIDIRGTTDDGTDDNQDRIPFREQKNAMGHAVRANYLYAGVADLYAETGEKVLLENLKSIWEDVVYRKMYITGACGALYDGVSPDGTSYDPAEVQKIHQAYGRPYQLPNATAHNETCANIGNVLWNWRMLQITGKAKYADVLELSLYNSVLSGISLEGTEFLYTNPLLVTDNLPFEQRWGNTRKGYIALSNCCPPNVTRTLAEVNNYAYSISGKGLYVNLYGNNTLTTALPDGTEISVEQKTDYPWDGKVTLKIKKTPEAPYGLFLRIPGWCKGADIRVNGGKAVRDIRPGTYAALNRKWRSGDEIVLNLPMPVTLMEANPLVEEARNQVAVKRGPLVYCLESEDIPANTGINEIVLDPETRFDLEKRSIADRKVVTLKATAGIKSGKWKKSLYRPLKTEEKGIPVKFVPYFTWGNRGEGEMTVWLPY
ncbi:glycoside hydrolase family 127 protein [Sinomicrobium kalidii]|uniref:aceric acid hydrolase n=1 Tax=Sinomicrobium kalidii TaxID=2900738 RepID=UPI001E46BF61|nr:glycoside hydrolase family 127 protein [Sinomicrobium kalidii]UGU15755.1 glycoside hydrolase family 127 protein [Sinomicrobium kalidii]